MRSLSTAAVNTQAQNKEIVELPIRSHTPTPCVSDNRASINKIGGGRSLRPKQGLIPVGIPKVPQKKPETNAVKTSTPLTKSNSLHINKPELENAPRPQSEPANKMVYSSPSLIPASGRCSTPVNVTSAQLYAQFSEQNNKLPSATTEPQQTLQEEIYVEKEPVNVLKYASAFENREKDLQQRSASPVIPSNNSNKSAKIPTSNLVTNMVRKCSSESSKTESDLSASPSLTSSGIHEDVPVRKSSLAKIGSENSVVSSDSSGSSNSSNKVNLQKKVSFQVIYFSFNLFFGMLCIKQYCEEIYYHNLFAFRTM